MNLGLDGRRALVLGASGGLGGAIAVRLAAEGAKVLLGGRSVERLAATADAIRADGGTAKEVPFDLADPSAVPEAISVAKAEWGGIDILVNNTGGPPASPVLGVDMEVWRRHFQAIVLSVIDLTDRLAPGMKERRWGRIVTTTSSGAVAPLPGLGVSNTLRPALLGWSKSVANELGPFGITVNAVVPGRIATARVAELDRTRADREGRTVEEVQSASKASIPLGRYGGPEEFGDVVAFLASERASYVTGSVIRVDGGLIPSI